MKRLCTLCERTAQDGNLMCVDVECPIKNQIFLGSGQLVGDVTIVQFKAASRTASFYEGLRDEQRVIVKIAHDRCDKQLRNEAELLADIARNRLKRARAGWFSTPSDPFPGVPQLLPAYKNASLRSFPYGQLVIDGRPVSFMVFEYVDGIPLTQFLEGTPQPWLPQAAHIVRRLARIVAMMNKTRNVYHANLNPSAVWVYEDEKGHLHPVLMDYGIVKSTDKPLSYATLLWLQSFGMVAYLAPEIALKDLNETSEWPHPAPELLDGYGLGLLLYQLLNGKPKYAYRLKRNLDILEEMRVDKDASQRIDRPDIEELERQKPVLELALSASAWDIKNRRMPVDNQPVPLSAATIDRLLTRMFGEAPAPYTPLTVQQIVARVMLVASVLVVVFLLLGILLIV